MPERFSRLSVSFLRIVIGTQLVSDFDNVYKVNVGVKKAWDLYLFGNFIAEDSSERTGVSSSCSRAAVFNYF